MNMDANFGMNCGAFSVALAAGDIILPGSKNQPIRKSVWPMLSVQETAGRFTIEAIHAGKIFCKMPVQTMWVTHPAQPEPFFGIKSEEPQLIETLRKYEGKPVEFAFTRI